MTQFTDELENLFTKYQGEMQSLNSRYQDDLDDLDAKYNFRQYEGELKDIHAKHQGEVDALEAKYNISEYTAEVEARDLSDDLDDLKVKYNISEYQGESFALCAKHRDELKGLNDKYDIGGVYVFALIADHFAELNPLFSIWHPTAYEETSSLSPLQAVRFLKVEYLPYRSVEPKW